MKAVTLTLAASGNPFPLWKVLTGAYTSGVAFPSGISPYTSLPVNVPQIKIQNEATNTGIIRIGDGTVSIGNKQGYPIAKGGEYLWTGSGTGLVESLTTVFIAVTDASQVVSIIWD